MKKSMKYTLCAVLVIILVVFIAIFSNPLRWSDAYVRNHVLKLTPIGMSMEDVIVVIEGQEAWETRYIDYESGYLSRGPLVPDRPVSFSGYSIIGEKSIRALVGEYKYLLVTSVTVFWGFDENSELIEVEVWKTVDGP